MLHRTPMPGRAGWFFAGLVLFSLSLWAQSVGAKDEVKHYGYSGSDKVLDCLRQLYGKPAASFPGIKFPRAADFHCPSTKDGISQWLQNGASSTSAGIHLFETSGWVYIIPETYVAKASLAAANPAAEQWKNIVIQQKIEAGAGISGKEAESLVSTILQSARAIPLRPPSGQTSKDGEADLDLRLQFYKTRLGPDAVDSVITIIDQPSLLVAGRLVYGEVRNGNYQVLWDSPLLNSKGRLNFMDVNADGVNEIVWRSALCGAKNCMPQQLVVFDRSGHELTRQKKCPDTLGAYYYFDDSDGVCPIEGNEIQFTVISPYPDPPEASTPKDIVASGSGADDKEAIYTLVNGFYVPSKLDFSGLAEARKKEAAQSAAALNERGQNLMKEEKYSAAADTFVNASQLVNSENTLYLENAGRAFYKAGNYKDSIFWLGMAISMDAKAAMMYLHRADAFAALRTASKGRQAQKNYLEGYCVFSSDPCLAEARRDYKNFLELDPHSEYAADVKKKLQSLPVVR
jgi:hypothetical protein